MKMRKYAVLGALFACSLLFITACAEKPAQSEMTSIQASVETTLEVSATTEAEQTEQPEQTDVSEQAEKTQAGAVTAYTRYMELLGFTPEEASQALGVQLQETDREGVYQDELGIEYGFKNNRLISLTYQLESEEAGFAECREVYEALTERFGEERRDNLLPDQKTIAEVADFDAFMKLPQREGSDGSKSRVCSSNWFVPDSETQWELANPDSELEQKMLKRTEGRFSIALDVRQDEAGLSMLMVATGVPK